MTQIQVRSLAPEHHRVGVAEDIVAALAVIQLPGDDELNV